MRYRHIVIPHLALVAASFLLMLPALISPPMLHDSFWIDWVWADQFSAELARGNPYPRWLPLSHGGLGSPVFYYYPPLAFYVSGAFALTGLSTYASIIGTFWAALLASGYAMRLWLKDFAPYPLAGALLFMAMPYHLLDFYGRGAQAEFMAIAFIPLVAWAMRENRPTWLALAYSGLILTHLPLALLVSFFIVGPYAIYLERPLRFAAPIALGVGLSAIYLWPALSLEPYRDAASLWTHSSLQPADWGFLTGSGSGAQGMRSIFAAMLWAAVPFIVVLYFSGQRHIAIFSAVCAIVAAGFIPGFWSLPLVDKVQFPFRLLPVMEFALATGAAMSMRPILLATLVPALSLSFMFTLPIDRRSEMTIASLERLHPDVPENPPPGERPYSWPSEWALQMAAANPGAMFRFPSWKTECTAKTLIPAGCAKHLTWTRPELLGSIVSLFSLVLLLLLRGTRSRSTNTRKARRRVSEASKH